MTNLGELTVLNGIGLAVFVIGISSIAWQIVRFIRSILSEQSFKRKPKNDSISLGGLDTRVVSLVLATATNDQQVKKVLASLQKLKNTGAVTPEMTLGFAFFKQTYPILEKLEPLVPYSSEWVSLLSTAMTTLNKAGEARYGTAGSTEKNPE